MSQFRIEKRRAEATITLTSGAQLRGSFFLGPGAPNHAGPERITDLLNTTPGFFPFERADREGGPEIALYNRDHIVLAELPAPDLDLQQDASYQAAPIKMASMLLSTGERIVGKVYVFRPEGRDRLSDYTRLEDRFRYLEGPGRTLVVNLAHVLEIVPISE